MLPRLVELGPVTIYSFGVLVLAGFLAGAWWAMRLARERGLPAEVLADAAMVILLAGIAGARLLFVALHAGYYAGRPLEIVDLRQGGMSFHGGLAAGVLAGWWCVRRAGAPFLPLADAVAPGLALGYAFGRVGCLLNGCCYGVPTTLPWGLHFPEGDPHLRYHPTQLYSAAAGLVLWLLLTAAYRRPHRGGQILALFLAGYSVYRWAVELLRSGVTARVLLPGLTEAQALSILGVVLGAAWWMWLRRHGTPAPTASSTPLLPASAPPLP